jgi:hypothetical protein
LKLSSRWYQHQWIYSIPYYILLLSHDMSKGFSLIIMIICGFGLVIWPMRVMPSHTCILLGVQKWSSDFSNFGAKNPTRWHPHQSQSIPCSSLCHHIKIIFLMIWRSGVSGVLSVVYGIVD